MGSQVRPSSNQPDRTQLVAVVGFCGLELSLCPDPSRLIVVLNFYHALIPKVPSVFSIVIFQRIRFSGEGGLPVGKVVARASGGELGKVLERWPREGAGQEHRRVPWFGLEECVDEGLGEKGVLVLGARRYFGRGATGVTGFPPSRRRGFSGRRLGCGPRGDAGLELGIDGRPVFAGFYCSFDIRWVRLEAMRNAVTMAHPRLQRGAMAWPGLQWLVEEMFYLNPLVRPFFSVETLHLPSLKEF
ncbi:hypothetical protein AMTR_s00084p00122300 [Amborella trichopoda]|uniref:Uncharacterized protein n=1 Tax=Amborella trichopoda TaxID=13333 RepID=W1P5S6_AMBTC|nr:hypothetical protein AMTR_s00084p00122300 [Amborella trichopoda]